MKNKTLLILISILILELLLLYFVPGKQQFVLEMTYTLGFFGLIGLFLYGVYYGFFNIIGKINTTPAVNYREDYNEQLTSYYEKLYMVGIELLVIPMIFLDNGGLSYYLRAVGLLICLGSPLIFFLASLTKSFKVLGKSILTNTLLIGIVYFLLTYFGYTQIEVEFGLIIVGLNYSYLTWVYFEKPLLKKLYDQGIDIYK